MNLSGSAPNGKDVDGRAAGHRVFLPLDDTTVWQLTDVRDLRPASWQPFGSY
ncbi:hypothetical protein [Austwickia chelonae]|uniref:hypothetical protein n=1 Tax=Austwickia chelonae TaxID=100225 RepID=UPI0019678EAE|nr:hypothetical protein [Austwickia chelonae]